MENSKHKQLLNFETINKINNLLKLINCILKR